VSLHQVIPRLVPDGRKKLILRLVA